MNVRVVGGIIAVVLMVGGYVMYGNYGPGTLVEPPSEIETVDAQLQAQDVQIFAAVKQHFPDDYAKLVERLAEMTTDGTSMQEIATFSHSFISELRQRNGQMIMRADDASLREIIALSRDLHVRVRDETGAQACNGFAITGPPALGEQMLNYLEPIDAQGALLMAAMASAKTVPDDAERAAATAEDWESAIDQMVVDSGEPAHRAALQNLGADADICAAVIALADTLLAMEGDQGERLRATYVRDLAIN